MKVSSGDKSCLTEGICLEVYVPSFKIKIRCACLFGKPALKTLQDVGETGGSSYKPSAHLFPYFVKGLYALCNLFQRSIYFDL